jgi:pimeloyl-ACP methyl ester carboxylesterase
MQPFPGLERWSREMQLPMSGIHLHIYDTSNDAKTPVFLVHGLGDEADTWRHVLPLLQNDYRVIAPDLPGFGRSEKVKRKYTVPFFVDVMLELIDTFSLSRFILAGHSMGAIIAQEMALEHPERVERLILISGSLVSKENPLNLGLLLFLLPGVGEWMYNRLRKDSQAAYQTLEPYYNKLKDLPQADRDFLYQRVNERVWSDGQRRAFLSTLHNLASWISSKQKGLPARLSSWRIPTTVIWGENDRINVVANAHALEKILPSARLVIVPGAGHNVQQEKAEVVAEAINRE